MLGPVLLAAAGALATAAPLTLSIDPAASQVLFHLQTTWHGVEGRTGRISGALTTESGDILGDGRVTVEIEAAALDTGNARRDRTMRDSHLETGRYPAIAFTSTGPPAVASSTKDPAGALTGASLTVPGSLAIHGVTRAVGLPVTARRQGDAWLMEGELVVKLSDYAIPDPSIFLNHVQDEVTVSFSITLRPGTAPPAEPRRR
jgi:polyisoprenoid-binding protein YceI